MRWLLIIAMVAFTGCASFTSHTGLHPHHHPHVGHTIVWDGMVTQVDFITDGHNQVQRIIFNDGRVLTITTERHIEPGHVYRIVTYYYHRTGTHTVRSCTRSTI